MPLRPAPLLAFAAVCFAILAGLAGAHAWWLALLALLVSAVFGKAAMGSARADREDLDSLDRLQSETRGLEAQLWDQRRAIDALADGLDAALFMCDPHGTILYANPPAHRLFGKETLRGSRMGAATYNQALESLVEETGRAEIAFSYPREWIGLAHVWRDPADDRTFVSVYEITELRRLERMRKDFVANVSHELRTPMTIIRGYAETLLDEDPPSRETAGRMLPRIISEVDRLSTIAHDLLTLSVAESSPVRKSRCDLAEVTRGVVSGLWAKAAGKGLGISYEGEESLPLHVNPVQIEQVVLNLVDNAVNYTAQGSVEVSLERDGDKAILIVRDTGLGISPEHIERVFERFYRVDRGRSRATGGTGLGLSIVRHIVEAHGGRVGLESVLGQGSVFRVELPLE